MAAVEQSVTNSNVDPVVVKLRGVAKQYQRGSEIVPVLEKLDLDLPRGDFVALMGPSGSGKTTLLNLLGGLDRPTTGSIEVEGLAIDRLSDGALGRWRADNVGFVFQSYHLLDNLTVYENIDLPLSYRDVKKSERQGMVADILDRFNIVGKKDLYPNQLSGGQQQLVAIARAVVANPSIILADEPTGNLHSDQGREIMELFARLNAQGTTIVQVTHSEANAAFGRRIIRLKDGWIVDAV